MQQHNQQDPRLKQMQQHPPQKCPRCESLNTKFCYYNNYSLSQPRYFCKTCRRYWTQGGTLRNVPMGGGCRKGKRPKSAPSSSSSSPPPSSSSLALSQAPSLQTQQQPPHVVVSANASNITAAANSTILRTKEGGDLVGSFSNYAAGGGFLSSLAAIHDQSGNYTHGLITSDQPLINQPMSDHLSGGGSSNLGLLQSYINVNLNPSLQIQDQQEQQQFYQMGVGGVADQKSGHEISSHLTYPSSRAASASRLDQDQEPTSWTQRFINSNTNSSMSSSNSNNSNNSVVPSPSLDPNQWHDHHHLPGYGPP